VINAQETLFSRPDTSEDMTITHVARFSFNALQCALGELKAAASSPTHDRGKIKSRLSSAIKNVSRTSFEQTPVHRAWDILRWGVDTRAVNIDEVLRDHRDTVELIAQAVIPRLTSEELTRADRKRPTSADVLKVLRRVESLGAEVVRLSQIVDN
jgi:hypothetical protein